MGARRRVTEQAEPVAPLAPRQIIRFRPEEWCRPGERPYRDYDAFEAACTRWRAARRAYVAEHGSDSVRPWRHGPPPGR